MVRVIVQSNETFKPVKYYTKFQRQVISAYIVKSLRENRYNVTRSEKNRLKDGLRRKIAKSRKRHRKAYKHRYNGR